MTAPVPLNRLDLDQLHARIAVPAYDVARVRAGIVHLGLGGFHRAHMARYTHDLMAQDAAALDWGIVGATLVPGDRVPGVLAAQDGLYTLIERDGVGERAAVIGSLAGAIDAGESTADLLDRIDDPAIRIVSLTVTGHGYCLDADRRLDRGHPLIVHDLANPYAPRSAMGVLVAAYRRRRDRGGRAFTALSCDNIPDNGAVLRAAVLALAEPDLAEWIAREGRFPSTMVDRITPVTTPADIAYVAQHYGVADGWPVVCEGFRQWVIEDDFADGRPDWDAVGAQFVADVAPYETMKLRLLNASHLAASGLGSLLGLTTIDQTMADADLRTYMAALMETETGQTVPPVPGIDLPAYRAELIARFANPAIRDTVARVNADASINYLLDPIRDRLAADQPIPLLALALAAWLRRVRGDGEPVRHPLADEMRAAAIAGGRDPRPLLAIAPLFGELGQDPRLIDAVSPWLAMLYDKGAAAALASAV